MELAIWMFVSRFIMLLRSRIPFCAMVAVTYFYCMLTTNGVLRRTWSRCKTSLDPVVASQAVAQMRGPAFIDIPINKKAKTVLT
ncbi:unnamed protein product [Rhodiola kirilowii]